MASVDKKPRKIVSLTSESAPVSVGILLDLSGSIGPEGKKERSPDVMKDAFGIIADNLQQHYQLSIENEPAAGPEKWRKFALKLNLPDEKGRPKPLIWSRPGLYQ